MAANGNGNHSTLEKEAVITKKEESSHTQEPSREGSPSSARVLLLHGTDAWPGFPKRLEELASLSEGWDDDDNGAPCGKPLSTTLLARLKLFAAAFYRAYRAPASEARWPAIVPLPNDGVEISWAPKPLVLRLYSTRLIWMSWTLIPPNSLVKPSYDETIASDDNILRFADKASLCVS